MNEDKAEELDPWLHEPISVDGAYGDVPWALRRGDILWYWCGYVAVPPGHPWYGERRSSAHDSVEVHGGVNYVNTDPHPSCLPDLPGMCWVGFDCAHLGDFIPALAPSSVTKGVYRDFNYALSQVEKLAAQAVAAAGATT